MTVSTSPVQADPTAPPPGRAPKPRRREKKAKHTLKSGHFVISSKNQRIASEKGLVIESAGLNAFSVKAADGSPVDLDALCPSFIPRDGNVFTSGGVNDFIEFLHQPIRNALKHSGLKKKGPIQEQRERVHRAFRLLKSGSPLIPEGKYKDLEKELHEDHADVERDMRDKDAWDNNPEINGKKTSKSTIPGSKIDLQTGFVFDCEHDEHLILFGKEIDKTDDDTKTLTLSADQLADFVRSISADTALEVEFDSIEKDRSLEQRRKNIEARKAAIVLDRAVPAAETSYKRDVIMRATTALSPLHNTEDAQELWARFHAMERHRSPAQGIADEFETLHILLSEEAAKSTSDPVTVEAIAQEFYNLISLSRGILEAYDHDDLVAELDTIDPRGFKMNAQFLPEDYRNYLDDHQRIQGKGGSSLKRAGGAMKDTAKEFGMSFVYLLQEDKRYIYAIGGIAVGLYAMEHYLSAIDLAEQKAKAAEMSARYADTGMFDPVQPEDHGQYDYKYKKKFHLHPNGVRHYTGFNWAPKIADWAINGFSDTVRGIFNAVGLPTRDGATHFEQVARTTAYKTADASYFGFLLQDLTHAAFWINMFENGRKNGLKGLGRVFELLGPVVNFAGAGAALAKEKMKFGNKTHLATRLARHINPAPAEPAPAAVATVSELIDAAQVRQELEQAKTVKIKKRGLRDVFKINAQKADDIKEALEHFDRTISAVADHIGVDEKWYQNYLQEKIRDAKKALIQFQEDKNIKALNKSLSAVLIDVMGAEIRHTTETKVFEAVHDGETPNKKMSKKLVSRANQAFGKMDRAHKKQELESKVSKAGVVVWDKIVNTARYVQHQGSPLAQKKVLLPLAAVITAGAALDFAGYDNPISNVLSSIGGSIGSLGIISTVLNIYNILEDAIGMHFLGGLATIGTGCAAGGALWAFNKAAISPIKFLKDHFKEKASSLARRLRRNAAPPKTVLAASSHQTHESDGPDLN